MKNPGATEPTLNVLDMMAIIAIIAAGFATLPYHDGISLFDSACYTIAAEHFVHGKPIDFSSDIFVTRIGTWLPQAFYVSIFGLNGSITWVTTIEFGFFLITLYWFLRKQDQTVAFMSVVIIGFLPQILTESSTAMGDILLMGILNLCVLIAWNIESGAQSNKALMRKGVQTGILWVVAFFTKESAVLFLPFFFWISFKAWRQKKQTIPYWKAFWCTISIAGIATMLCSGILFGDPFWKIHGAEHAIAQANTAYGTTTFSGVLKRWTIWPAEMFAQNYSFGLLIMLATPFLLFNRDPKLVFWKRYAITTLLTWIFWSQRITEYSPIGLIPRLWLPILPALAIASAYTTVMIARKQDHLRDILTILVIGSVWLILNHFSEKEALLLGRDTYWIRSTSHHFAFILIGVTTISMLPKIPDLMPNVRPLIIWVVIFPSCFGSITHSIGRMLESSHRSSYDYGREASRYLRDCNPERIMTSWIYSRNYPIFGISELPVSAYGTQDSVTPPNTYLLLNTNQIAYERSGAQECISGTETSPRKPLEEYPERFGFRKIWNNKMFEIWKN